MRNDVRPPKMILDEMWEQDEEIARLARLARRHRPRVNMWTVAWISFWLSFLGLTLLIILMIEVYPS